MSWSFRGVGKPAALQAEIDKDLAGYGEGPSREEFETAAPHLKGLIGMAHEGSVLSVTASGSEYRQAGARVSATVAVDIKDLGKLVE